MTQTRWFYLRSDSTDESILSKPKFQGAAMRPCDLCDNAIVPADIADKPTAYLCEPCGHILAAGKLRGMVKVEADGTRWNRGNPEGGQRLTAVEGDEP